MTRTKRTVLALVAAASLAACGGSKEGPAAPTTSAAPGTTERAPQGGTDGPASGRAEVARPEGDWQFTRYFTQQTATGEALRVVRRAWHAEPNVNEGPCDVAVTPAGPRGTFLGIGYPVPDDEPEGEPFTMAYEDGHYRFSEDLPSSCTLTGGGYSDDQTLATYTQTFDLTYRAGTGDEPDRWFGSLIETSAPTAEGEAAGCAAETETVESVVSGVPGGLTFDDVTVDGSYAVSYVFGAASAPDIQKTPDLLYVERAQDLANAWSVSGACEDDSCAIGIGFTDGNGATRALALTPGAHGWSGRAEPATGNCKLDGGLAVIVPDGYRNVVEVTDLQVVDAFEGTAAVLVGDYASRSTPSEAAATTDPVNCYEQYVTGQVILVNTDLLRKGA